MALKEGLKLELQVECEVGGQGWPEAHLLFELIHFLLKKPLHQFQFLFNLHHSFLHDSYQLFLVSLKGRKSLLSFPNHATLKGKH